MRLIDADALNERMYHDAFETDSDMQKWDGGCWIRYKMFENAMKDAPTVDAKPVARGEWKVTPIYIKCSVCGESFMLIPQNFCPNCGADMRGESGEKTNIR